MRSIGDCVKCYDWHAISSGQGRWGCWRLGFRSSFVVFCFTLLGCTTQLHISGVSSKPVSMHSIFVPDRVITSHHAQTMIRIAELPVPDGHHAVPDMSMTACGNGRPKLPEP
jgi:hypothetical protein